MLAAGSVVLVHAPGTAAATEIVSWAGNAPGWNERLGTTTIRQGCSAAPAECLQRMKDSARTQQVGRWALAVKRGAGQWPGDALEYSRLSLTEPLLAEVDIDDFLSAFKGWQGSTLGGANRVFADITMNLKRHNPRLRFGITLYEDELDSRFIAWLPAATRARVDRVSLYLHYRANAGDYPGYVADVRRLFPRAVVWAGSYAYDRIDYMPCGESGQRRCSNEEEIDLYRDSLRTQLDMLRDRQLDGIEFYPGFFGREDQWYGWDKERICRPERRRECIENTRRMRAIALEELAKRRVAEAPAARILD